jgi:hypothetical protein
MPYGQIMTDFASWKLPTEDEVRRCEEIVNESEHQLSVAQIRDLFFLESHDNVSSERDTGARQNLDSAPNRGSAADAAHRKQEKPSAIRRPSGRGREVSSLISTNYIIIHSIRPVNI